VNILNQGNHAALSPHMATSIALDPFPTQGRHDHPGRVVNGVQVVTCPARTISSRLAAANLTAAGLDDYIVSNFDHNVELAVAKEIRRRWRSFAALARRIADTEFGDPKRDMHVPRRSYTARCGSNGARSTAVSSRSYSLIEPPRKPTRSQRNRVPTGGSGVFPFRR
jgi:hypothetical protein